MTTVRIILGDQLFPLDHMKIPKATALVMIEDLELCQRYAFHKHKIAFFLASMRHYAAQAREAGYTVHYYDAEHPSFAKPYVEKLKAIFTSIGSISTAEIVEVEDIGPHNHIVAFLNAQGIALRTLPSPMFLVSRDRAKSYLASHKKPFMKTFYQELRKSTGYLMSSTGEPEGGQWSFDTDNRKKLPKSVVPPEIKPFSYTDIDYQVFDFVESTFQDHPGTCKNFWLPTTRSQSLRRLGDFVEHSLPLFGSYQDALTDRSKFVFHSLLSPMLNAGLLIPEEVIQAVIKLWETDKKTYPLNSVEGFLRQVIGWREFVRMIYHNFHDRMETTNFWQHTRKLGPEWYQGNTGIPPLDDCIKKANETGYNHHIERLMVVSNLMLLSEIHPKEVYRWFMEMFVDSADWVMAANVFGMGQFSEGGIFATKPYICGSNYLLKMSHYKKESWCDIVDGLYWRFVENKREFLSKNYRLSMMVRNLDKMSAERKGAIFDRAETFLERCTV
ncbi:MAG: cryptochrome/photolyase family protein [Pseudobacteriovorax sp.]|nr:cryptochrome/photolyase family protein [Pseudobacteriovorax sp.]